ncbi:MAG: DnaA regulatory inactivator Hda [Gammaproteobacteria bacterium]|nr:DnaA regulatory inactivator Hda [Gammaproteobacteria bacterium]
MRAFPLPQQATLSVQLPDEATFDSFYSEHQNAEVVARLKACFFQEVSTLSSKPEQFVYLWGSEAVGRTHLLQAVCHACMTLGKECAYLPLRDHKQFTVEILEGLEMLPFVCLDDIDYIASNAIWEEGLFHLYNRIRDNAGYLIVSAKMPPREINICLPDLKSRLMWGATFQLHELSDEEKVSALVLRAKLRGIPLSAETARFLVYRLSRDMQTLLNQLQVLDEASLVAKHTLTLPFVRSVLEI